MKKIVSPSHIWKAEKGLTVLLAFLVVTVFIAYPFIARPLGRFLFLICFSFLLISGAIIVFKKRLLEIVVTGIVLVSLVLHWIYFYQDAAGLAPWIAFFNFLSCCLLAIIVLLLVFREGSVTIHRITGAIAVYLLFGLMWGFLFNLIALQVPDAFKMPYATGAYPADTLQNNLIYFSFVTLTTLGYGDILAVHPFARMLVILEALTGQLFPAILLARLVSLEILHKNKK